FEKVYLALSDQAVQVINTELGLGIRAEELTEESLIGGGTGRIEFLDRKNYFSPPASGSFRHDGMVIVPCSMGTAGRIANGISDDPITRAPDVRPKAKRP